MTPTDFRRPENELDIRHFMSPSLDQFEVRVNPHSIVCFKLLLFLFQQFFALLEVESFQPTLCSPKNADPSRWKFPILVRACSALQSASSSRCEDAQQLVVQREPELIRSGVSLSRTAPHQLPVDPDGTMQFRGQHMQPAGG